MATFRKTVRSKYSKLKGENVSYVLYQVDWYDFAGKRHRKNFKDANTAKLFKSQIELQTYRIKADLETPLKTNMQFTDMVDEYLVLIDGQKKQRTIDRERTVFKTFARHIPLKIKIREINSNLIRLYCSNRIEEDSVKPATVNSELRTLKSFFNILILHEYVQVNPVIGIKMLPIEKTEPRAFSDAEVKKLLGVFHDDEDSDRIIDPDYFDLVRMYLHTGARREELLPARLPWDHIDLESKTIMLTGKFDQSRTIPLDNTAYEIVKRRSENGFKFPFDFDYHYMYKKVKKYMEQAGIKDGTLHCLRRSYASKLIQNGASVQYVAKFLGHKSLDIAFKYYINIVTDDLRKVAITLDESWVE